MDELAGRGNLAAAVGDVDRIGVEQFDQAGQVAGFVGGAEGRQHAFALRFRNARRRLLRLGHPPACPRGELPGRGRRDVQHLRDPGELQIEDVVQDEGHPLRRGQLFHDEQHRGADGVVDEHGLGRVRPGEQRFGQPRPDVGLPAHASALEDVVGAARGHGDQPRAQVLDVVQVGARGAQPHVLGDILGVGHAPQQPVGHAEDRGPVLLPLGTEPVHLLGRTLVSHPARHLLRHANPPYLREGR
ncbi:hypothetical protein QP939_46465 [Amycolatopsis nalaikhensis]|uniref:Uncharacterized protein n=1 Tax=Amycolatopsis nalaikhensis TaxID=715472 RepID=A0ABY8XKJ2_9PSEU|nr:hypothetical protein [Amycolatopsis sp. 2-2]WIV56167.1 hypothetical protein QP939_46465 [Amycolatopsis sp. 2-2]